MAVIWQDVRVGDRSAFDGQRQADALSGFQKAAGLDATKAARAVSLSYPQYNRYLWGQVPLRTDQIAAFAAAYGVKKAELTRALGLLDDAVIETETDDSEWDFRAALEEIYPDAPERLQRTLDLFGDAPPSMQRVVVEAAQIANRAVTSLPSQKRAIAG